MTTIEKALEHDKYGFGVTYDGDRHKELINTTCNRCGNYFESELLDVYCDDCIKIGKDKTWRIENL